MDDEITMVYKVEHNNRIKILGYDFIKNNKGICKIKIFDNETELKEIYEFESDSQRKKHKTLEIKLIGIKKLQI